MGSFALNKKNKKRCGDVANEKNLKKGALTQFRSGEEAARNGKKGGKASGEARRRKADFRKTLNMLLTMKIDDPNITPVLEALGIDSTLESAVNMAMIKEAMGGNVKAYEAIAKYAGQTDKPEEDIKNREADTELKKARKQYVTGENETHDAIEKLDEILKGLRKNAVDQEAE